MKLNFTLNNKPVEIDVDGSLRLIDILRDDLDLTGTKEGCSEGECGACTVIINGKTLNSCLVLGSQVQGKDVLTIEGLQSDGAYSIIQKEFIECGAIQCGFCTPGMVMSTKAILMDNPDPTLNEIKKGLEGNLCRCTGYNKIEDAVLEIAKSFK
jgi:carbon-monoxide dehydrogenase small subunit